MGQTPMSAVLESIDSLMTETSFPEKVVASAMAVGGLPSPHEHCDWDLNDFRQLLDARDPRIVDLSDGVSNFAETDGCAVRIAEIVLNLPKKPITTGRADFIGAAFPCAARGECQFC
jgi:hypothetical protein